MAFRTGERLPTGNSWDPSHPNFFPPPKYYKEFQLTEKPIGLLKDFTEGIRLHLQPGWMFRAVLGDEGYLIAVYVHPSRIEVNRRIPPYDRLVKPEAVAQWVSQENPSNHWALEEEQLNAILARSNMLLDGRASAQYNDLFVKRYYDPEDGGDIIHNMTGGDRYYQTGVGLVIAHFRTLESLITYFSRRRESLAAQTRTTLSEIDQDIARIRSLIVDNPRSLFRQ